MTKLPTLLDADSAATYAGVKPATLRVWRHRYGLTTWQAKDGQNLYSLDELAAIMAKRGAQGRPATAPTPSLLDVLDAA